MKYFLWSIRSGSIIIIWIDFSSFQYYDTLIASLIFSDINLFLLKVQRITKKMFLCVQLNLYSCNYGVALLILVIIYCNWRSFYNKHIIIRNNCTTIIVIANIKFSCSISTKPIFASEVMLPIWVHNFLLF